MYIYPASDMASGKRECDIRHPPDPQEKQDENGGMSRPSLSRERAVAPSRQALRLRNSII